MKQVTQTQFARLVGVTEGAVRKAVKSGELKIIKIGGKNCIVDPERAERAWHKKRNEASPAYSPNVQQEENSYTKANIMLKAYKAQLAKLDYEEKAGKLIEKKLVGDFWANKLHIFKTILLSIPKSVAYDYANNDNAEEIEDDLNFRIRQALIDLANQDEEN